MQQQRRSHYNTNSNKSNGDKKHPRHPAQREQLSQAELRNMGPVKLLPLYESDGVGQTTLAKSGNANGNTVTSSGSGANGNANSGPTALASLRARVAEEDDALADSAEQEELMRLLAEEERKEEARRAEEKAQALERELYFGPADGEEPRPYHQLTNSAAVGYYDHLQRRARQLNTIQQNRVSAQQRIVMLPSSSSSDPANQPVGGTTITTTSSRGAAYNRLYAEQQHHHHQQQVNPALNPTFILDRCEEVIEKPTIIPANANGGGGATASANVGGGGGASVFVRNAMTGAVVGKAGQPYPSREAQFETEAACIAKVEAMVGDPVAINIVIGSSVLKHLVSAAEAMRDGIPAAAAAVHNSTIGRHGGGLTSVVVGGGGANTARSPLTALSHTSSGSRASSKLTGVGVGVGVGVGAGVGVGGGGGGGEGNNLSSATTMASRGGGGVGGGGGGNGSTSTRATGVASAHRKASVVSLASSSPHSTATGGAGRSTASPTTGPLPTVRNTILNSVRQAMSYEELLAFNELQSIPGTIHNNSEHKHLVPFDPIRGAEERAKGKEKGVAGDYWANFFTPDLDAYLFQQQGYIDAADGSGIDTFTSLSSPTSTSAAAAHPPLPPPPPLSLGTVLIPASATTHQALAIIFLKLLSQRSALGLYREGAGGEGGGGGDATSFWLGDASAPSLRPDTANGAGNGYAMNPPLHRLGSGGADDDDGDEGAYRAIPPALRRALIAEARGLNAGGGDNHADDTYCNGSSFVSFLSPNSPFEQASDHPLCSLFASLRLLLAPLSAAVDSGGGFSNTALGGAEVGGLGGGGGGPRGDGLILNGDGSISVSKLSGGGSSSMMTSAAAAAAAAVGGSNPTQQFLKSRVGAEGGLVSSVPLLSAGSVRKLGLARVVPEVLNNTSSSNTPSSMNWHGTANAVVLAPPPAALAAVAEFASTDFNATAGDGSVASAYHQPSNTNNASLLGGGPSDLVDLAADLATVVTAVTASTRSVKADKERRIALKYKETAERSAAAGAGGAGAGGGKSRPMSKGAASPTTLLAGQLAQSAAAKAAQQTQERALLHIRECDYGSLVAIQHMLFCVRKMLTSTGYFATIPASWRPTVVDQQQASASSAFGGRAAGLLLRNRQQRRLDNAKRQQANFSNTNGNAFTPLLAIHQQDNWPQQFHGPLPEGLDRSEYPYCSIGALVDPYHNPLFVQPMPVAVASRPLLHTLLLKLMSNLNKACFEKERANVSLAAKVQREELARLKRVGVGSRGGGRGAASSAGAVSAVSGGDASSSSASHLYRYPVTLSTAQHLRHAYRQQKMGFSSALVSSGTGTSASSPNRPNSPASPFSSSDSPTGKEGSGSGRSGSPTPPSSFVPRIIPEATMMAALSPPYVLSVEVPPIYEALFTVQAREARHRELLMHRYTTVALPYLEGYHHHCVLREGSVRQGHEAMQTSAYEALLAQAFASRQAAERAELERIEETMREDCFDIPYDRFARDLWPLLMERMYFGNMAFRDIRRDIADAEERDFCAKFTNPASPYSQQQLSYLRVCARQRYLYLSAFEEAHVRLERESLEARRKLLSEATTCHTRLRRRLNGDDIAAASLALE